MFYRMLILVTPLVLLWTFPVHARKKTGYDYVPVSEFKIIATESQAEEINGDECFHVTSMRMTLATLSSKRPVTTVVSNGVYGGKDRGYYKLFTRNAGLYAQYINDGDLILVGIVKTSGTVELAGRFDARVYVGIGLDPRPEFELHIFGLNTVRYESET